MPAEPQLTTTSYAILGLLTLREWTTYELAQQMRRGFRHFWPRAASNIYAEPKRLARVGLAKARKEKVGKRERTVYGITAEGRRAFRRWLREPSPGGGPVLESELLVKIFFNEHSTKRALLGHIETLAAWAEEMEVENVTRAREYLRSGGPFPERLAQIVLMGRFINGFTDFVADWSATAKQIVEDWPEDLKGAEPDLAFVRDVAARTLPGETA